MGNNISSSIHAGPNQSSEPPRSTRRDNRHPIPVHTRRGVAAPPEPSLAIALAQGTTPHAPNSSLSRQAAPLPTVASLDNTSPAPSTPPGSVTSTTKPVDVRAPEPPRIYEDKADETSPVQPVAVPYSEILDTALPSASSVQDMSYMTRPPRLPLPIEEEVHTPGSPIIAPADLQEPLDHVHVLDTESLPRRSSTLSSSTLDEEDAEELRVDKTRPTVPTRLEWLRGGDKVYVTGTIFHWNRKTRLHPVEGRPGVFATSINILPGTHHIRFLVDGQMQTSPDLPTTVDFGNNLVNYIEVSPDDVPLEQPQPSSAASPGQQLDMAAEAEAKRPHFRDVPLNDMFSYSIPGYLQDFDQPEDSQPYASALSAIEKLPNPPTLPSFLGKPILNHATLIKDDNSVLNMPNHTVLNHLMTSSIKNNVLAVSGTTRYKDKYVTTIIYKPTSADGN